MFVYGDVVYAQTWQVLTLKNCMEPFSYASAAYVVASALVSVRLFCKNLGNLKNFFGQMIYRPPWQKITRTPMMAGHVGEDCFGVKLSLILGIMNSTDRQEEKRNFLIQGRRFREII